MKIYSLLPMISLMMLISLIGSSYAFEGVFEESYQDASIDLQDNIAVINPIGSDYSSISITKGKFVFGGTNTMILQYIGGENNSSFELTISGLSLSYFPERTIYVTIVVSKDLGCNDSILRQYSPVVSSAGIVNVESRIALNPGDYIHISAETPIISAKGISVEVTATAADGHQAVYANM